MVPLPFTLTASKVVACAHLREEVEAEPVASGTAWQVLSGTSGTWPWCVSLTCWRMTPKFSSQFAALLSPLISEGDSSSPRTFRQPSPQKNTYFSCPFIWYFRGAKPLAYIISSPSMEVL